MPLLSDEAIAEELQKRSTFRLINVSSKLNRAESESLDALAKKRGLQRGELIRQIILAELQKDGEKADAVRPELVEIVTIRLMLTNLFKPLVLGKTLTAEVAEGIIAEVNNRKKPVALKLQQEV
jgi:hypothetical protein